MAKARDTIKDLNALETQCAVIIKDMEQLTDQVITRARNLRNALATAEKAGDTASVEDLTAKIMLHDSLAEAAIRIIEHTRRAQKQIAANKSGLLIDLLNSGSAADQTMARLISECQGDIGGDADDAKFKKPDQDNTGTQDEGRD